MEYRMYCLVLRQLSAINKGIQCTHSCLEYAQAFYDNEDYQKYIQEDKTLIMLDGGTSPEMEAVISELQNTGVDFSWFEEPDLNNLVTAISFIADERVWDRKKYPSLEDFTKSKIAYNEENRIVYSEYGIELEWRELVGGMNNVKLIEILKDKRLSL